MKATLVLRRGRAEVRIADDLNNQLDFRVFDSIRDAVEFIYRTLRTNEED